MDVGGLLLSSNCLKERVRKGWGEYKGGEGEIEEEWKESVPLFNPSREINLEISGTCV